MSRRKPPVKEAILAVRKMVEERLGPQARFMGVVRSQIDGGRSLYYEVPLEVYRDFDTISEVGLEAIRISVKLGHLVRFHPIPSEDAD